MPKTVFDKENCHALFVSSSVPFYSSREEKKEAYDKLFIKYGPKDAKGKIIVSSRRALCIICKTHLKLEELHHAREHLRNKHPNVLEAEDYPADAVKTLQSSFDDAVDMRRKHV